MTGYYSKNLRGERLMAMYDAAPPRIKQYLRAEVDHVRGLLAADHLVLELGCGYGRVLREIADRCQLPVGIDTSFESLQLGKRLLSKAENCYLLQMDATLLAFGDNSFDVVLCIQNGISAFHVDKSSLIIEALRVTRPGGRVIFSTYTGSFWAERLKWFEEQARDGYIGPIDYGRTGNGRIVCTDGFGATTVSAGAFRKLAQRAGVDVAIYEIDGSSLFCDIRK